MCVCVCVCVCVCACMCVCVHVCVYVQDLDSLMNQAFPQQCGGSGGVEVGNPGPLSQGYLYTSSNPGQGYGGHQGALSQDMMGGAGPMASSGYMPVIGGPRMTNHYQPLPLHHHPQHQQQQQLIFPSALPSSYPTTLSGIGLQSTFTTYDGKFLIICVVACALIFLFILLLFLFRS